MPSDAVIADAVIADAVIADAVIADAVIADAVTASQPQWTASVHMRWRAEVSRLIVPVAAPAASAVIPKQLGTS